MDELPTQVLFVFLKCKTKMEQYNTNNFIWGKNYNIEEL